MTFPNDYSTYDAITIDQTQIAAGGVDNMDIWLPLSMLSPIAASTLRSDGGDARFTLDDGSTRLAHDIIHDGTELAGFRVNIPNIADNSDTVFRCWYNGTDEQESAVSSYGQHATYNSNVAAYWPLNNDPDSDATDAILDRTSNANHGTSAGSMTSADLVDGKVGKCLDFDGSNDRIAIPNNIITGSAVSIEMWFKLDSESPYKQFDSNSATENCHFIITTGTGGLVQVQAYTNSGWVYFNVSGYDLTQWHHVMLVAVENDALYMYIDGVLVDSASIGTFTSGESTYASRIGSDRRQDRFFTHGRIDEVRITLTGLDASHISTRYNNESNPLTFFKEVTAESESTPPSSGTSRRFPIIGSSIIRAVRC